MTSAFDVVIVGAGIHGAGIAQAAAAAGHSVLVLEQSAVAAGSSSRSSKLIHGGLRYLESWQWRLVRESLHERALMLQLAPDLVHLRKFFIPVYRHTRRRPWQLRIGLSLYALLAGCDRAARFGTVPRSQWSELDGLDSHELEQVFWYHDAQTDDALLTGAVLRSAQSLGARLELPARFIGATLTAEAAQVRYQQGDAASGTECECSARVLINAAGPWAESVARAISPAIDVPTLQLVQGTHIVLDYAPRAGLYYLESPRDGRAIFIMPWHGRTLVGTTEVRFHGDPAAVTPAAHEIHYLLSVLRHYFPHWRGDGMPQVVSAFAGLRVLPGSGGHAFHRSRETLLHKDRDRQPRVLSVYGGKLTTWRAVADRALQSVAASLPQRRALARTDRLLLK